MLYKFSNWFFGEAKKKTALETGGTPAEFKL